MPRSLPLLVCVFFSLNGVAGRVCADAEAAKPARITAVIPFTLGADGRIYVQALLNGSVKATFLVDTGNDVNYFSAALEDTLKAPLFPVTVDGKPGSKPATIDGRVIEAIVPKSVVVGQINLTQTPFLLMPPKKLPSSIIRTQFVDGVLGSRTLERFAILLDFKAKQMHIWYPSGLTNLELKALNLSILYTVPIAPSPANPDVWVTPVQLTSEKATAEHDLTIDTGAEMTTIPYETADQLKLAPNQGGTATLFLNKKVFVSSAQVARMQAGNFVLLSHPVFYPDRSLPGYPVSIGMDVFRGYFPLIDFGQRVMYLSSTGIRVNSAPKK